MPRTPCGSCFAFVIIPFSNSFSSPKEEESELRASIESLSPRGPGGGGGGGGGGGVSNKEGAIVALAAKCSQSILNPDFLLGKFLLGRTVVSFFFFVDFFDV